ncbi:PfkB family carbohydrate kinase [Candidatus Pseudothioglobus sp. Uisw_016]|uniref:PfkB family carbohydrate kinase n=1 Tax=Candidatus Pseudothioglobus sp. Uisw_016 TaxID=3230995 RepID=UPI003A83DBE3
MITQKITSLNELENISLNYKKEGKSIVLCHGMFDLIHLGHIRYFQQAKKEGDILIVTLTSNEFCRKGPDRPIFSEDLRAESLAALEIIDHVAVCPFPSAIEAIKIIKPNIYAKGKEYEIEGDDITKMISKERQAVELNRGKVFFTDDLVFSSSNLLNRSFEVFTPEVKEYISNFKLNHTLSEVLESINAVRKSKVLVIGESIIDRYTFVTPLGQTGKGIHTSVSKKYSQDYPGGSIAVANHIGSFVDNVTLFTGLGGNSDLENYNTFITNNLMSNITQEIFNFKESETIIKERFVDDEMDKFFEIYHSSDGQNASEDENIKLTKWLESNLEKFDIVVVPDYGNGFITESMTEVISRKSKFLAVNTQINSGNRGYHVVNRYKSANFISLNEPEIRLARHNRKDSIAYLSKITAKSLNADFISVTQGSNGLHTYQVDENHSFKVPALSSNVIDRVGAGDAFLSLASIFLGSGINTEISVFIGATAAAIDVQIIGNQNTVNNIDLIKYISALLK